MKKNHVILVSALILIFLIAQAPSFAGFASVIAYENEDKSEWAYTSADSWIELYCSASVWTKGGDAWAHSIIYLGGTYPLIDATAECVGDDEDYDTDSWSYYQNFQESYKLVATTEVLGTGGAVAYASIEWTPY